MIGAASIFIEALERTWAEIQDRHDEIPGVVMISGTGKRGKGMLKLGHWNPTRWRDSELSVQPIPEVMITGECMAQGAGQVLQTLIHEATHGLANVRKIKDTSRGNRYHNRRFVALGEELGLVAPEAPHTTIGWSSMVLPDEVRDSYESLPHLAQALVVCIGDVLDLTVEPEAPIRTPKPVFECDCGRKLRLTEKTFEEGPVICGLCTGVFLEVR